MAKLNKYKKDFPITLLHSFEDILKNDSPYYKLAVSDDLLKFIDADSQSKFYFSVKAYQVFPDERINLSIQYEPKSKVHIYSAEEKINLKNLKSKLSLWENILKEFSEIEIFEDPLIKQYEEEFITDFEILDEDAYDKSYNLNTQIQIDRYLDYCNNKFLEIKTEENKGEVEKAQEIIVNLKNNQTRLTKRKVVEQLVKIWAWSRKLGLKLLNDIYEEGKKELVKQLLKQIG